MLSHPERLTPRHNLAPFTCGRPALDHWLKTRALSNQEKGFTVVIVVHEAGRGVGTGLLRHALERSVEGARLVGGRALVVNALDSSAAAFWRKHGFVLSKDNPLILFRSTTDIAASLAAV